MKRKSRKQYPYVEQTFDPENFDIHASRDSIRDKIWPAQRDEKMVNVKKDLALFQGKQKGATIKVQRSMFITLFSNILLPGLGNTYVKHSAFSISILALSAFVAFTTASPLFPLVSLLSTTPFVNPTLPVGTDVALFVPANVVVENQVLLVGPTFSILAVPFLLSWIHLLYLFLGHSEKVEWKA